MNSQYRGIISRTANLFRYFYNTMSLEASERIQLTDLQVRDYIAKRSDIIKDIKSGRSEISKIYRSYGKARAQFAASKKESLARMRQRIAQYEVDILSKNIEAYAGLFRTLRYGNELFADYMLLFKNYCGMIENGSISDELESALRADTLFTGLKDFDRQKLSGEINTKNYIRMEGLTAVSRLVSVLRFYRSADINIAEHPSAGELKNYKSLFNERPWVMVSSWRMNEKNYARVDKKAVKYLANLKRRRIWSQNDALQSRRFNRNGVSITVPEGWKEVTPPLSDKYTGSLLCSFNTEARDARIDLVMVSHGSKELKEAADMYSSERGAPVMKTWAKRRGVQYYRTVSRADDSMLVECYAFRMNGLIFILSGTTDKARYGFFTGKLKSVFESIDLSAREHHMNSSLLPQLPLRVSN